MTKHLFAIISLLLLFAFSGTVAQAGTSKLPATFKYNGQTLRTGPHKGFNVFTNASINDDAAVLAISEDGNWLFVWSDSGDGWVPTATMDVDGGYSSLSIWSQPIRGYSFKPEGNIMRATDLKNGANAGYDTLVCIPPQQFVKVLAQSEDGFWLFVWSDAGDGWVPRSAVSTDADLSFLAVWAAPIHGAALAQ